MTYPGLQKLKYKLDQRLKTKEMSSGCFKAMERKESIISMLPPPVNPVKWAVSVTSSSSDTILVESSDSLDQTSVAM